MKEIDKMRNQEMYYFSDSEITGNIIRSQRLCARLQTMTITDNEYRGVIEELIPSIPHSTLICPPFHCDHGTEIHLGEHVFINYNCTMLDSGDIHIGSHTKIGPNCQFYTPNHPTNHIERREPKEIAHPIRIGEDCWIGGGVIICPGVTIGKRCIIAAGSVVTHDIPDDSLAAGVPAVVKRKL
jgi:maltose O-acetyltransferase